MKSFVPYEENFHEGRILWLKKGRPMDVPLIEFKDVTKRFGPRTILERVNLQIYEDQVTTLIGLSGSGKSVLLKHIVGLLKPDEGTILFRGKPLHQMKKKEIDAFLDQMSYMFQGNALFDSMTVYENVAIPIRETMNLSKPEIDRRVMARIEQAELDEAAQKYPSQISVGMRKRAALARALIIDPQIVLFDEPTAGLDPVRKNAILSMIAQYHKKFGFTAILVSHEIPDIFFISNRIPVHVDSDSRPGCRRFHGPVIHFISRLRAWFVIRRQGVNTFFG
jgi:phospholipid/cholesterol/gamma-HCH transport system ATP-binding protein